MIPLILSCLIWSNPNIKIVDIPVDEYGMSSMKTELNDFSFEALVTEEAMSSVKITLKSNKNISTESYSNNSVTKNLATKIKFNSKEASLDCEVKEKLSE